MIERTEPATRLALLEAHGNRCFYCGDPLWYGEMEVEHIIPRAVVAERLDEFRQSGVVAPDWEMDGFTNLVPACRACNRKKRDYLAAQQHLVLLLTLARAKVEQIHILAEKYAKRAQSGKLRALLEQALEAGAITLDDFVAHPTPPSGTKLTRSLEFHDIAVSDLTPTDVRHLREKPLHSAPIDMQFPDGSRQRVTSVLGYDDARNARAYPATATDLRCEGAFKNASAIFRAVQRAREPRTSHVRAPYVGVCDIGLVPSSLVQILGVYEKWEPLIREMPTIGHLVDNGVLSVEAVGATFIRVKPKISVPDVAVTETSIGELLRADISGEGSEDIMIAIYGRAVGGSHGHSAEPVLLVRPTENSTLQVVPIPG